MASLLISAAASFAINLLFPPKGQNGPRLSDLKLQGSQYGTMIPIVWGSFRVPGIVVWQTDLTEHKHNSGGKGGPTVTTFTYTASFAVKLCKGPIQQVRRIWADGRIIYSVVPGEQTGADLPMTVYLGDEAAPADPTMEAILGVGNVPAFRDDVGVVFTDLDLSNYGNRLPNLNFEVAQYAPTPSLYIVAQHTGPVTYPATEGPDYVHLDDDGNILAVYTGHETGSVNITTHDGQMYTYTSLGVYTSDAPYTFPPGWNGDANWENWFVGYLGGPAAVLDGTAKLIWYSENHTVAGPHDGTLNISGTTVGTFYASIPPLADQMHSFSLTQDGTRLYVFYIEHGTGDLIYSIYDDTGTLLSTKHPTLNALASTIALPGKDKTIAVEDGGRYLWRFDAGSLFLYSIDATTGDFALVDSMSYSQAGNNYSMATATNGYCYLVGGSDVIIFSRGSPVDRIPLYLIVDGISDACSQPARDTSALTDLVDGYAITQQMTGRDAITQLQMGYYFDPVESSTSVKFAKRGSDAIVSIPDDDLAAAPSGSEAPPILATTRMQEEDLPAEITVSYINVDAQFEIGTQTGSRQTMNTQDKRSMQLSIVMPDSKGKEIACRWEAVASIEREKYTITVPRKYAHIEPTDVISAGGRTIRIVDKDEQANDVIKLDGVATHPSIFVGAHVAATSLGISTTIPPSPGTSNADLFLLDIPKIDDNDSEAGFYAAATTTSVLFKSSDGGTTYAQIGSVVSTSVGSTTTALGDWTGGNVFDESNSVTVVLAAGTLSSATELAVLNGANEAVIGAEIVQFKTATLVATDTYTLTGLLRGRRGTEFTTGSHVVGDQFVLLPVTNVPGSVSEINQARVYKAVRTGGTLAAANPVTFTNTGIGLRPYSPVLVGGAPNTSGDVVITWTRRTRIGGAWLPFVDASLGESSEQYVVQIWDATYTNCARVISGLTTPTCTYTSAQQVADFGAQQQTIYCSVGQVGQVGLGVQTHAAIPGAGGSNTAPSAPVPPFGYVPPSTSGCTLPTTTTNIPWASLTAVIYSGFSPGHEWDVTFDTPSSWGATTGGHIVGAESTIDGSGGVNRNATLSTSPCGSPLTPYSQVSGNTVTVPWFTPGNNPIPTMYPTLQLNTTYHFSITTDALSSMFVQLVHN